MNQFTKGPWGFSAGINFNGFDTVDLWAGDAYKVFIAEFSASEKSREETEANAKLASAAPDLYEALQELVDSHSDNANFPAINKARAALSKVTAS